MVKVALVSLVAALALASLVIAACAPPYSAAGYGRTGGPTDGGCSEEG